MGMRSFAGHWEVGSRAIFFLRWDQGVLRTIYDTWAYATPPIVTGAHPDYKARPGKPMADTLIDFQLDKGEGCSDEQQADAVNAPTRPYNLDPKYFFQKLRWIAANGGPLAREAARKQLDSFEHPYGKMRPAVLGGGPEHRA